MLKKYTIFDNFDKLDLSPAASRIIAEAPYNMDIELDKPNDTIIVNTKKYLDNFIFNKYNDTLLNTSNKYRTPYNFDMTKYAPDMYRFMINKRFFIDKGGAIEHTSNIIDFSSGLDGIVPQMKKIGLERNVFGQHFFLTLDFVTFGKFILNNTLIYDNDLLTIEAGSTNLAAYDNYFTLSEQLPGGLPRLLHDSQALHDYNSPFLGGLNRVVFAPLVPPTNAGGMIFGIDLIQTEQSHNAQMHYILDNLGAETYNGLLLYFQRILFPFKTIEGNVPRHPYLVADLEKSYKVSKDLELYTDTKETIVTPVYNYYKEEYEGFSSNVELEWQLPNAYAFYSFLKAAKNDPLYTYYRNIVKIDSDGSGLDNFSIKKYYDLTNQSLTHIGETDDSSYSKYLSLLRHKSISFGGEIDELSEGIKSIKKILPYYNEIQLPSFSSPFINKLASNSSGGVLISKFMTLIGSFFSGLNGTTDLNTVHTFSLFNGSTAETDPSIALSTLQILDFSYGIDFRFLSDIKNILRFASSGAAIDLLDRKIVKDVFSTTLREFLMDYSNVRGLTFNEIDKGKKCYTEILAFEVAKYKIINGEKTHIQSFYVPCTNEKGKTLIDTQIFYGEDYIYETFSISLVVGAEYTSQLNVAQATDTAAFPPGSNNLVSYDRFKSTVLDEQGAVATYNSLVKTPSLSAPNLIDLNAEGIPHAFDPSPVVTLKPILVRAPYDNVSSILGSRPQEVTTLLDNPPLPPEISFNSFKDVQDKVLISLNVNYGQRKMKPIPATSKYANSQKSLNLPYGEVLFKTDDFNGTYAIYRTTTKPMNWDTFDQIKTIDNQQLSAFEDNIMPNVDYYYYATFMDVHGNVSNPTSVFYLRIVKEGGFPPYMVLKPYSFSESMHPPVYEKRFKKYIKIKLTEGVRSIINEDDLSKADLKYQKANSGEQLKKYKVRVVSKKTGKKIDININFGKIISSKYLVKGLDDGSKTIDKKVYDDDISNITEKIANPVEKTPSKQEYGFAFDVDSVFPPTSKMPKVED